MYVTYISHPMGRTRPTDWFVVDPKGSATVAEEVRSLVAAGRRVVAVVLNPADERCLDITSVVDP